MKSIRYITSFCVMLAFVMTAHAQEIPSNAKDSFITKPSGSGEIDLGATINLDSKGYPMLESFQTIYDEMDYQGAVSAYLQAMPQMNLFGSLKTAHYYGATGNTDSIVMHNDPSIDGMLTPNRAVTYLMNYANLPESGPMVFEQPAGATAGLIMDMQMRWHADTGLTSPYQGKRVVKYLVLTEDQELPDGINKNKHEYVIVRIRTNRVWYVFRNLDPVKNPDLEKKTKINLIQNARSRDPISFSRPRKAIKPILWLNPLAWPIGNACMNIFRMSVSMKPIGT